MRVRYRLTAGYLRSLHVDGQCGMPIEMKRSKQRRLWWKSGEESEKTFRIWCIRTDQILEDAQDTNQQYLQQWERKYSPANYGQNCRILGLWASVAVAHCCRSLNDYPSLKRAEPFGIEHVKTFEEPAGAGRLGYMVEFVFLLVWYACQH